MDKRTTEDHLKNIALAVNKCTGTFDQLLAIRESYNHVAELLKEYEKKELDKKEVIKP